MTENLQKQLEEKAKYALVFVQEDGIFKVMRFSPGKPLEHVTDVEEGEALVLDGIDCTNLLNPKGPVIGEIIYDIEEDSEND
jgi:hypothetical protein